MLHAAWRLDYPSADITSLHVGQIAPTAAVSALHGREGRERNPRQDPPPVEATRAQPQPRRSYRMPQDGGRPRTRQDGVVVLAPTLGRWAPAGAISAPTGAPPGLTGDPASHVAYDPVMGLTQVSGSVSTYTDGPAHTVTPRTDRSDPRRESGGYAMADPAHAHSLEAVIDQPATPVVVEARIPYQRPPEQFLGGRPATRPLHLFLRPFDQEFAHHMSGLRLPIAAPPTFGPGVAVTPRASRPIMTTVESDVPGGDAYPGPTFAAPGMRSTPRWINTLRVPPTPHDAYLVDTGR